MPVTSREIMEICEIKNVKTLTRWYQAGLIPEPNVQRHPGGAGRIAFWPEWVLNHCRAIKQLTANGQTIEQIKETFGSDWETIAHRYQRYNFLEVSQKMDFDNAMWSVQEVIDDVLVKFLGDARESILSVNEPLIVREIVIQGLDLMRQSYNPVLILAFERIVVVPDFRRFTLPGREFPGDATFSRRSASRVFTSTVQNRRVAKEARSTARTLC